MPRLNPRLATCLTLGLLAVIGAALILAATPEGLGLSDDSIAYIAGARSLLAGQGYREAWLESNQPVTHFPPVFSGTLALIGLTGLDPLRGARFLNALLFGLNAALLGCLGWRMTKSSVAGIMLAALFIINDSLLRVHAVAMSEPLFLFFSLLAFLCFNYCFNLQEQAPADRRRASNLWLIAAGLSTSLAYLTRYSGLALVATFVVALILLNQTWKKRITSVVVFLAGFTPLVFAWSIRNWIVAGNTTNRTLLWHPVTGETLEQGLRTFSEFLIPMEDWRRGLFNTPQIFLVILLIILLTVLVWVLINGLRRFFNPSTPLPEVIGFTNGLYLFGYLALVLFSISLFDASTPLKVRILAPLYLPLLLLLVGAGIRVWNRRQHAGRAVVIALALIIFGMSIFGQAGAIADLSRGGTGFASFKWYDSEILDYLKTLPSDFSIYTNEPGAVYLYTGRASRVLPDRVDPVTGQPRPGFEAGAEIIQADVLSGRAVLVIFDAGVAEGDMQDYRLLTEGLYLVLKAGGDAVYYAPPP